MKRIIIATVFLLSAFLVSIYCESLAVKSIREVTDILDECIKEEDEKLKLSKFEDAVKAWNDKKKILYLTKNTEHFSEIETNISDAESNIKENRIDEMNFICENMLIILEKQVEDYRINADNIF